MRNAALAATGFALLLAGCYVIPIDSRNPPPVVYPGAATAEVASILPAQPQPVLLQARLYPINDIAGKMGALTAQVTDSLNGHGTFTLSNGNETLQGEATRVANDHPGFGAVYRQVYGDGRFPAGGRRGIANAVGNHGSYINCEYVLTAAARGTGACLFSNGAKYQIHFGG